MTISTICFTLPNGFARALRGLEAGTLERPINPEGGFAAIDEAIRSALPKNGLLQAWQFRAIAREILPAYRQGKRQFRVTINL